MWLNATGETVHYCVVDAFHMFGGGDASVDAGDEGGVDDCSGRQRSDRARPERAQAREVVLSPR